MDAKWKKWDLRLFAEKRPKGGYATNDDWRLHITDLKDGQEIEWNRHGGFYHSPYKGDYHFIFLGAENTIRLKAAIKREKSELVSTSECEQSRPEVKAAIKREKSELVSTSECEQSRPEVKVAREEEQIIMLDLTNEWTSGWYEEADGCEHRVTLSIIEATYPVSELPEGVRTMQQTDHDAWEYAVRNGLI